MSVHKTWMAKVSIDRQGYDKHGTYWGVGAPLYQVDIDDGTVFHFRANSRQEATKKRDEEMTRRGYGKGGK